ncbi:MAG: hypothetical protein BGN96_02000 [Bacteroidales bacterium 45-6]|nr:MAG: hypothetical protein BGN96_02000 [Bacteroidales bacterium 45-6]
MKQLLLWATASVLMLTSCGKGTSFAVKGKLTDKSLDGKVLLLQKMNFETGETKVLDSTVVKGDEFQFKGEAKEEPDFNVITPKVPDGKTPSMTFVREPGDIVIEEKAQQGYTVSGTKTNDQFQKMQSDVLALQQKASQVTTQEQQEALIKQIVGVVFAYAKENMQNPTGEQLFGSIAYQLTSTQLKELLTNARPAFTQKEQVKMLQKSVEAKEKMLSSNQYQDVEVVDVNGAKVSLSAYVGKSKYVLVDFWASWCRPCIEEMPHVVAAYAKFKSKGLEVVGISVDKDKESWLKAVAENRMSWIQLNDANGNASQIYAVQSIPFTLLIDQTGKIVAQNLRGEALEAKLSELLP